MDTYADDLAALVRTLNLKDAIHVGHSTGGGEPTLIIHGDDDQIEPIGASALLSSKIVKEATLKVYPGAPHGLPSTLKDHVNADLLAFFQDTVPAGGEREPAAAAGAR